jgi:hypothetical protein
MKHGSELRAPFHSMSIYGPLWYTLMIMMDMFLLDPIATSHTSTYHHLLPPKKRLFNSDSSWYFIYSIQLFQAISGSKKTPFLQVAYSILGTSTVFST